MVPCSLVQVNNQEEHVWLACTACIPACLLIGLQDVPLSCPPSSLLLTCLLVCLSACLPVCLLGQVPVNILYACMCLYPSAVYVISLIAYADNKAAEVA